MVPMRGCREAELPFQRNDDLMFNVIVYGGRDLSVFFDCNHLRDAINPVPLNVKELMENAVRLDLPTFANEDFCAVVRDERAWTERIRVEGIWRCFVNFNGD